MSLGVLAKATKSVTAHMKELRLKSPRSDKSSKNSDSNCLKSVEILTNNNVDPSYIIYDATTDSTYLRGKLLGKGGFAKCYELIDLNTHKIYAGKIISKNRISKPHQKQKIVREVDLHRNLKHRHVVEFHSYFEDDDNVYIVLENCSRKSLVHVLRQRKVLTEPEVRYYIRHLVEGIKYIHNKNIIHRDLKLGNMLLGDHMEVKIADFGLATKVDFEGEKKMTVCGTPNYIAPEVLQKKGHSFQADIWAVGCIMYALLVGRPPFETATLKETYVRITANTYLLPANLSNSVKGLIRKCLTHDPELRPTLDEILADEFLTTGYNPKSLSTACCTSVPKFPVYTKLSRPMSYAAPAMQSESMMKITSSIGHMKVQPKIDLLMEEEARDRGQAMDKSPPSPPDLVHFREDNFSPVMKTVKDNMVDMERSDSPPQRDSTKPCSAATLLDVLTTCLDHMPHEVNINPNSLSGANIVLITKWVDYSNKYGFGFQLSTNAIGVLFNDTSRIILGPDGRSIQYYDLTGRLSAFHTMCVPEALDKKTTLLLYFARYMDEHLIQGGHLDKSLDLEICWSGRVYVKKWFRTTKAIVFYMSDGTFQVNFFDDHTKVILSQYQNDYLVTYIDEVRLASTFSMMHLIQDGCREEVADRMVFAKSMLQMLVDIEGADI